MKRKSNFKVALCRKSKMKHFQVTLRRNSCFLVALRRKMHFQVGFLEETAFDKKFKFLGLFVEETFF